MIDRAHRNRMVALGLRTLAVLVLLVTSGIGVVTPATAQGAGAVDVAIVTTENGQPAYDACYVLVGYSNIGCDENGDGQVTFQDIPLGTYTIRQTAELGSGRYVNDFTIQVTGNVSSAGYERFSATIVSTGGTSSTTTGVTGEVAIITTENGQPAYDACYVLVDYSNIGCDENRDGKVTFAEIPWGTYTVRQTANLGPGRYVDDFIIEVRGNVNSEGFEAFPATIINTTGGSSAPTTGAVDIALITRDPQDGHLLTGACYVLVDYSNVGCDENADGQVTFAAIPYGTYTVRQTQTPAGYPTINDYTLDVEPDPGVLGVGPSQIPVGFIVKQAPEQNAPNTRNVSVVLLDAHGNKVISNICFELIGASNVGCDEDLRDGQIDFLDVPVGEHEYRFTGLDEENLRAGGGQLVTIDAWPGAPVNQILYFVLFGPGSGSGTDAPDASAGEYDTMVGEWFGKRRDVTLNADGTGTLEFRQDPFGNGLTYALVVDPGTAHVSATIVGVTPHGDIDLSSYPTVGHTITLELQTFPDGVLLVVDMNHDGWELTLCSSNDEDNVQNACY